MDLLKKTLADIKPLDEKAMDKARERQYKLTKPPGSLGRLEDLSIIIAGIQRQALPEIKNKAIFTFAGDHHVVFEEDIASAPMEITAQQVLNFVSGGGAVNALANHSGARLVLIDMGVATPYDRPDSVKDKRVGKGASNISRGPAMTRLEAVKALEGGIESVLEEIGIGLDIIGVGEMGIGNTTPASAIYALYTGADPEEVTGPGAGIDDETIKRKIEVIRKALDVNKPDKTDPIDVLAKIGGFEIGGMAGAMLAAASKGIPVVVDGFISTAAALLADQLSPEISPYLILSHHSAERGYGHAAGFMKQKPLLDLGLRLGEGTGAALGISLCEAAVRALKEIRTFDQAGVTDVTEL
ncbi:nicotinate-nucleotide--dimethylbenzimidazole phosphoribosyltransferase [Spirochaeta isovalerica]|uniref:Nicotinate-nucleotide--dimethylbenzimidazole phosphoribosyltransferase n=1 Tax=Spirochaeta isovalerica TaxID=150 RepID=A0A841R7Q5_9SPIO|nr:nicotinate-nucleotide--dimethylbenzimidazole phosphoribosyltransferase [Spirochaeta isovalerica]